MPITQGDILEFSSYLEQTARPSQDAVVWKWHEVAAALASRPHNVQGTLVLADGEAIDRATIAPGLSLVIQVLKAGETTKPHRHSFWHLYIVRSGSGEVSLGADLRRQRLVEGDVSFVPAWYTHAVHNLQDDASLVLFRLQNLPQNASLGTLAREDDGRLKHIYARKDLVAI
ncbi:cupin domain-containing protein [Paraburkholderia tropica]|uniref:cupin domain-containing protein n=1 Tax=Paraburkholderia tropica TaxID=92647 RepID=UPI002AB5EF61|nr:cupin domain-containing protein [Paraburkholderia tropica]